MPSITASVSHFSAHSFDTMHSLIGIVALLSYNIALTASEQISACPSQCICVETRMNCDQPGLQHLPPPYMSQLKYLVVENQTFASTHLGPAELSVYRSPRYDGRVQLRNIQLRFCNIRTIGRYAFKHLGPGLELIDLTGNPLQQIGDYVFDGLSNLILILDRVTTQPRMTLNTFANVGRVKSLIVRNAEWTSLPFDALHQLAVVDRKLDKLVLKGNRLTHLDEKFDPIFQNLHAFEINDNPWHCDCQLNWIVRRYRRSLRTGHDDVGGDMTDWGQEDDKPKCTSPESLAGYNFTDLITELNELYNAYDNVGSRPPSILHCPPPQLTSLEVGMQKLSTNKKNQIIVRHESEASIELQCSVRGSKGLTIDWHYHDPVTRSRTILNKGSMGRGENIVHDRSSLLTQKSVWVNRVNDWDRYTCLARDVIGNVSADVVVHWPELVISSIGGSKDTGDVIEPVDVSQSNQLAGDQSFMYSKQYTLIQLIGTIIGTFICTVLIFILILCIRQRVCKIYSASLVKRKTCDPDLVGRDNMSPGGTSSSNTSSFATKSTAKQPVDNSACLTMPNGNGALINPYMLFNNGCFHPNDLQRLMSLNQTPATASDLASNHPAYTFNAPQSNEFNSAVYDVPQTINSTTMGYNFQPNPMLDPTTLPLLGPAMATSQGATLDPNRLGPTIMIPPPPSSPQPALPGQFPGLIPPSSSYSTTNGVSLQPTTLTHNNINT